MSNQEYLNTRSAKKCILKYDITYHTNDVVV